MRAIRNKVRAYYSAAVTRYGPTPLGVDWQNQVGQDLRFIQLLKICRFDAPISLNDFGCGYGALLDYLMRQHRRAKITYHGIDLSPAMIAAASQRFEGRAATTFAVGATCRRAADYCVASGVFNVRLGQPVKAWEAYVEQILFDLCAHSRVGFAVNFKRPHDEAPMENELYRTPARRWVMFCRNELGCAVTPLTSYGLREFTLLVRKRG